MAWLLILAGLTGLFLGGELLVRGALALSARLALPPVLVGLTVVGFGTSMPELLVSLDAALRGAPAIAIGNVVGSNIANILLIAGLAALVWPIRTAGVELGRDLAVMLAAALALVPVLATGEVTRGAGLALLAGLLAYLAWSFLRPGGVVAPGTAAPMRLRTALGALALGLAGLVIGARLLVEGAVNVARDFGLSEAFVGLTVVAVGTSLPELATSMIAALRRQSGIAIGNVVGSNIFNVLGILGLTAIVAPIPAEARFLALDLPVMLAASVLLAALLVRPVLGRTAGLAMLVLYAGYVGIALA